MTAFDTEFDSEMADLFGLLQRHDADIVEIVAERTPPSARNEYGLTPLMAAVAHGRRDLIPILSPRFSALASSSGGETALMLALATKKPLCALDLIPISNLEARNLKGDTALMYAVKHGQMQVLETLLPLVNPNPQEEGADSPLMLAAERGNAVATQLLLPTADLSWENGDGETALSIAAREGGNEVYKMIVGSGRPCRIDARSHATGRTALMQAIAKSNAECVAVLAPLSDLRLRNRDGQTAWDMALKMTQNDPDQFSMNAFQVVDELALLRSLDDVKIALRACPEENRAIWMPKSVARWEAWELQTVVQAAKDYADLDEAQEPLPEAPRRGATRL